MRVPLMCSVGAAVLLWAAPATVRSQETESIAAPKKQCPAPACSTVVNAPPLKVRIEMAQPEVVFANAAAPAAERQGFLQRCGHFHQKQPYYVIPVAPAAPIAYSMPMAAPVTYAQPVAAPMSYSMPVTYSQPTAYSQPVTYSQPVSFSMPVAAPVSYSQPYSAPISFSMPVSAPVAAPTAAQQICCGPCASQPTAAPVAAPVTPTGTDVNEALRKLTKSVDLLTGIVDRHTDVLTLQQQQLKAITARLDALPKTPAATPFTPPGAPGDPKKTGMLETPAQPPQTQLTVVPPAPLPVGPATVQSQRNE